MQATVQNNIKRLVRFLESVSSTAAGQQLETTEEPAKSLHHTATEPCDQRLFQHPQDVSIVDVTTLWSICQTAGFLPSVSAGDFPGRWMRTSPGSKHLEANGIAKADRVIGCRFRQTEVAMKIELLMRRDLVCRAEIDHVLRTAALGKGT